MSARKLSIHPAAEFFRPPTLEEYEGLDSDIQAHGLLVPIVIANGLIVDGRTRYEICLKRGIEPRFEDVTGKSDDALTGLSKSLNYHRRHLTLPERWAFVAKHLKATPEKSDRLIAALAHVSDKTVGAARRRLVATAEIPQLDKTIGKDGKARAASTKPKYTTGRALAAKLAAEAQSARRNPVETTARTIAVGNAPPPVATKARLTEFTSAWMSAFEACKGAPGCGDPIEKLDRLIEITTALRDEAIKHRDDKTNDKAAPEANGKIPLGQQASFRNVASGSCVWARKSRNDEWLPARVRFDPTKAKAQVEFWKGEEGEAGAQQTIFDATYSNLALRNPNLDGADKTHLP